MRLLLTTIALVASVTLNGQPLPLVPATVTPTSFAIGSTTVAAADGRFLSAWLVDTTTGNRVDGLATDANAKPTAGIARRLVTAATTARIFPRGSEFLLSYEDMRRYRHFMRLSADGVPIGDESLPVFTNSPTVYGSPDGKRILVFRIDTAITGELLDENGVLVRSRIPLSADTASVIIVPAGDGFLVLRRESGGLTLRAIHPDGRIDTDPLIIGSAALDPTVGYLSPTGAAAAVAGSRLLLFWNTRAASGEFTSSGVLIENGVIVRNLSINVPDLAAGKLFWTGQQYVLIASKGPFGAEQICAMRFDANAEPLDAQPVVITDSQSRHRYSDAAWNGRKIDVVGDDGKHVLSIALPSDGPIGGVETSVLSLLPTRQNAPVIALGNGNSLAVWRESGADEERLRAAIVQDGIAADPITLTTGTYVPDATVAYGDGIYLVAWETQNEVRGCRITTGGLLLDPMPFLIALKPSPGSSWSGRKPAIAWNGSAFLVAWTGGAIQGTTVTTGRAIGTARVLMLAEQPALAWNGERFLLAGTRTFTMSEVYWSKIYAATLLADGTPVDSEPREVMDGERPSVASSGEGDHLRPGVGAFPGIGHEFLMTATNGNRLMGIWLDSRGGAAGTSFPIAAAMNGWHFELPAAAVVWTGSSYVVAAHSPAVAAHSLTDSGWSLRLNQFEPLHTTPTSTRAIASRPDWGRITSAAVAIDHGFPTVVFAEISDADAPGGSTRLLIDRIDDVPLVPVRRRTATH